MADVLSVIADVLNQDKRQKKEQAKIMREVQKKLKEKGSEEVAEEEGDKEDYMKFFAGKLKKYGVKSPAELDDEKKKKFFNEIEKDWTHDSKEEVEVEKKEENLGKRVTARLEADSSEEEPSDDTEEPEEDEDEDPVGDSDVVAGGEPSEEELEKLADLVVQKIKDKADEEEEEEEEPEATEAESGKKEKIEVNPKMESYRNPHARNTWEEALRQVYAVNEEKVELSEEVADILIRKGVGKMNKQQVAGKVMTNARKLFGLKASVNGEYVRISGSKKKVNDYLAVIIGRSSTGDATQPKGLSDYPDLDKQLTKDLKTAHGGIGPGLYREEVELDERAKGDSIEGPAKGKKHKCPTYVKKEGYGYGKNISHSLSKNIVDKMNIYWYDSKEVSYMMPINEVEIVEAGYHSEEGHTAKFKSTKKIAEELSKLPNPFETIEEKVTPTVPEEVITEKRSVAFVRKFYQKGEK